ncbi:MAG: DUF4142 domain-containing protein [Chryseolinea sp.]
MRNAIVFINMCIVAAVTLLVMDFDTASTLAPTGTARAAASGSSTGDSLIMSVAQGAPLATLKTLNASKSRRTISESESAFVRSFISEMSRVRMSSLAQARMATQRGTSRPLKDYGAWIVINQERMIKDLTKLARLHHVEAPDAEVAVTTDELSDLQQLHGKKFDTRYIKLMTAVYKRDLKLLERAGYSTDPDVQVFAARYLSITGDNLAKLHDLPR